MRTRLVCLAIATGFVLAPMASLATDVEVEAQLQQMQERMSQMEDRLQATTDQLESANDQVMRQQEVLDRSGIAEDRVGASGLQGFFDRLQIGGWVAGSYNYNWNAPNGETLAGSNTGSTGFAYPFHPDSNSFSLDQFWMELEHPVDESNRAGFRVDMVYGKTGQILSGSGSGSDSFSGSSDQFNLYQGYVQYLAPVGPEGVTFKFGKFATLLGAEVAPTVYNWNITRGNVYNMLQPITQVGVLMEVPLGAGFDAAVGYVNESVSDVDIDLNKNKALTWRLGWTGETLGASFNGTWGSTNGALLGGPYDPRTPGATTNCGGAGVPTCGSLESDKELILDAVVSWDPTESLAFWANADYRTLELDQVDSANTAFSGSSVSAWGGAIAGRYAFTDRFGFALRGEYVRDDDGFFSGLAAGGFATSGVPPKGQEVELYSVTGTFDYDLTEALKVRLEGRYDTANVHKSADRAFNQDKADKYTDDQVVSTVEVIYQF
jgi:hypothetical protein